MPQLSMLMLILLKVVNRLVRMKWSNVRAVGGGFWDYWSSRSSRGE